MVALRQIQEVKAGAIVIQLPAHFQAKRVEVIIMPIDEKDESKSAFETLLLTAPTLTDVEIEEFQKARDWMNTWTVNGF